MYQTCTRLVTDLYQTAIYIPFLQPMATLFLFVFLFYSFLPFFPFLGPQPFTFLAGGYIRRDSQRLLEWQPVVECRTNPCEDAPEPPQQPHFHARTENTTRTTANTTTIATPENRNMQYDWWIVALCCIWDFGGRMWMCVRFLSPCSNKRLSVVNTEETVFWFGTCSQHPFYLYFRALCSRVKM